MLKPRSLVKLRFSVRLAMKSGHSSVRDGVTVDVINEISEMLKKSQYDEIECYLEIDLKREVLRTAR